MNHPNELKDQILELFKKLHIEGPATATSYFGGFKTVMAAEIAAHEIPKLAQSLYAEKIAAIRKQRNDYQQELIELRRNVNNGNFPTRPSLVAHGHVFARYLYENEYAQEMKCRCGYVIPPCYTEDDVTRFMLANNGEIVLHKK